VGGPARPYLGPRAISTWRNGRQSGPIGKIDGVGPETGHGLVPDGLSGAVTGFQGESGGCSAGKQPPAGADATCLALTPSLANPPDMLGLTDPGTEGGPEVLGQLQPCCSGDAGPLQDRRQILGDGPALVVAHRPTGQVDQVQVVGKEQDIHLLFCTRIRSTVF